MAPKKKDAAEVEILEVSTESVRFHLVGSSPFVCNAMSTKVKGGLVAPPPKKSRKEREASLKHNPLEEYRASIYRARDDGAPTRIVFPAAGFKRAMANAALEIPGVNRTQIGRLLWAEGDAVSLYGVPQLFMSVVRSADMNHTPDIRTRAIIPEWAATIDLSYVTPNLRVKPVTNLLASAGVFIGVGDGRPEKGALNYGRFRIVAEKDAEFQRILKTGGIKAQDDALAEPVCYDAETEELLEWWNAEVKRRGFEVA